MECRESGVLWIWGHITNRLVGALVFCTSSWKPAVMKERNDSELPWCDKHKWRFSKGWDNKWRVGVRERENERDIERERERDAHTQKPKSSEAQRCEWSSHLGRGPYCPSWFLQDQRSTVQIIPSHTSDPWNCKQNKMDVSSVKHWDDLLFNNRGIIYSFIQ